MARHTQTISPLTGFYSAHGTEFQLRRRALKIMSFVISANRLFVLTQSPPPHTASATSSKGNSPSKSSPRPLLQHPYICDLSPSAIQTALTAAPTGSGYLSANWNEERQSFVDRLREPEPEPEPEPETEASGGYQWRVPGGPESGIGRIRNNH